MTAQNTGINVKPLLVLLLAFLVAGSIYLITTQEPLPPLVDTGFSNQQNASVQQNSAEVAVAGSASLDWEFEYTSTYLFSATSGTSWTAMDASGFGFPDPNSFDPCRRASEITGKPCNWEVSSSEVSGEPVYKVELKSGRNIIADAKGVRTNLSNYPELANVLKDGMFQGARKGWLTYIGVAKFARGVGVGRAMIEVLEKVIVKVSTEPTAHMFLDGAGWGDAILKNYPNAVYVRDGLYLWIIK